MLHARRLRYPLTLLCLLVVTVELTGCATISKNMLDQEYYLIEPSVWSVGEPKTSDGKDPCQGGPAVRAVATDELVITYTDCIKKMLRRRMNLARIARLTSSSFAVLTAAAAAALGATAAAPLTAITALAATSAVIPEFSRIFGADERARAYQEGVALIEEAEGRYLLARAESPAPAVAAPPAPAAAKGNLTVEGANLYVQTVASIKIVEHLLAAKLPSIDDILRAQGRVAVLGDIQVHPTELTLTKDNETQTVLVSGGVVIEANPSDSTVVEVVNGADVKKGTSKVQLKRLKKGPDTKVTVTTLGGRSAVITVKTP